ncbi:hypothetical protein [Azospirillum sp. TSO5]|uniref:hypothetical protein n=1 Tax=Azospirillum sp. TSO5 TaxID=716760 RepID=UPI001304B683|nr:hypothetical protein [Azospirillum sp. TSO5]
MAERSVRYWEVTSGLLVHDIPEFVVQAVAASNLGTTLTLCRASGDGKDGCARIGAK